MSKKKTVNQTGLGDSQFDALSQGQQTLSDGQVAIGGGINDLSGQIASGQEEVMSMGASLSGGQDSILAGQTAAAEERAALVLQMQEDAKAAQAAAEMAAQQAAAAAAAQQQAMDSGFNNVMSGQNNIMGTVTTEGQTTRDFINLQNERMNEFNNIRQQEVIDNALYNRDVLEGRTYEMQNELTDVVEEVGRVGTSEREALKEAVLAGQVSLTDLVNQYGQAGATYYEALAANQATAANNQAALQTGLTGFQEQYTSDFANQADFLGNLNNTVTGGFNAMGAGQSNITNRVNEANNQAVAAAQANTQAIAGVAANQEGQSGIDYGRIARDITSSGDRLSSELQAGQSQWTGQLDNMRNILLSQSDQLDDVTRTEYGQLVNAFDQQGKLINESIDEAGIRTARAIDENGNLLIAQFDQAGNRQYENILNINAMLANLENTMTYNAGGNYYTGNLSPANNRRGGIMSPYTTTAR